MSQAVRPSAPVTDVSLARLLEAPGFGRIPTEHMVRLRWSTGAGWRDEGVRDYGAIPLDPMALVLHYGQSVFEGLKVYRQADGTVAAFRATDHADRLNRSARRLAMPAVPRELFLSALHRLTRADARWIPRRDEHALYVRPLMVAVEPTLGVRAGTEYLLLFMASPSGPYFAGGVRPVSVWASETYVRAAPGGTGAAKCAGNYAAGMAAQREAEAAGCDQVLWLDAAERSWAEEMGAMNLFVVFGNGARPRLATPRLGTILPGITRDCVCRLARAEGLDVAEEGISLATLRHGARTGRITEVFATGTAAVITPVGRIRYRDEEWRFGDERPGPVALRLRRTLLDIQYGRAPDPYGWTEPIRID